MTATQPLEPGKYQVDVSLVKKTTDKDNCQRVDATVESRVDPVQGSTSKMGSQAMPSNGKVPLVVGISAAKGNFHYEGDAALQINITGPTGRKGQLSIPVKVENGSAGSKSVAGQTGGRTTFTVASP